MLGSPTKRILVADDVKMLALKIAGALSEKGYETAIASEGEQCLEMVESFDPDLLILDIMMPKIHGIEVLKRVQSKDVGVIVCTGKGFKTDMSKVQELGAVDVIFKPIDQQDLIAKVEQFFDLGVLPARGQAEHPAMTATPATAFRHELKTAAGVCQLWGTRGSIPVSEARCLRHGGNTSCMSIEFGDHHVIFDAGSGIRQLGLALMAGGPRKIHLFITHTHWDHIQGFPFFTPAYVPGFEITIHAAEGFGKDLRSVFQGQLDDDYFPVQMEDMAAQLNFKHLPSEPVRIGDALVTWEFTQHPGATVGYRFELAGKSVAWVPDNEFLKGYTGSPFDLNRRSDRVMDYEPIINFLEDVDLLVHECQYTHEEYLNKIGWGHSSVPNACLLAGLCRARRWVVTHHDPMHDDSFLQRKLTMTRQLLQDLGHPVEVSHGFDGWIEHL